MTPVPEDGRLSYDALPVIVWTTTPGGGCDYVNTGWLEFTGRPAAAAARLGLDRSPPS